MPIKIMSALYRITNGKSQLYILLIPDRYYVNGELSAGYDRMRRLFVQGLDDKIHIIQSLHGKVTSDMYYSVDGHWNEKGNEFVARELMRTFKKIEFVMPLSQGISIWCQFSCFQ